VWSVITLFRARKKPPSTFLLMASFLPLITGCMGAFRSINQFYEIPLAEQLDGQSCYYWMSGCYKVAFLGSAFTCTLVSIGLISLGIHAVTSRQ
jgi:hypothetical protein